MRILNGDYEKSYIEMIDGIVIWKQNLKDIIQEIAGDVTIYINLINYEYDFDIDGTTQLSKSQIKEIEINTSASFKGKYCDWCFEYKEDQLK